MIDDRQRIEAARIRDQLERSRMLRKNPDMDAGPAISAEARSLLAERYREDGLPWFAADILAGKSSQFDRPLQVITGLLVGVLVRGGNDGREAAGVRPVDGA